MLIKILIISLSFVALFFSGCAAKKQMVVAEKKAAPSWVENPPLSASTELYALGFGRDKQSAVTDALSRMASTLSVFISSKASSKIVVREGGSSSSNSTYVGESQSEVKKIRIGNYQVLESTSLGFKKYAVLITSNKANLFKSMKQELDQEFEIIAKQAVDASEENAIKQLAFYKKTKDSLSSLPNKLLVMNELRSGFDSNEYLNKMNAINSIYANLRSTITFSIASDTRSSNLKAPIAKGVSAEKFKIADGSGKKHFRVYVNSKVEEADAYGLTLARSAIEITVKDYKNAVIGSNKLNIVGQSSQGFAIAKENVAIKLNELIKKEGLGKVLGLDI